MNNRSGRAYIFVRWSTAANVPGRLGEVAWAFEYIDRLARFVCFHCGAAGTRPAWTEKCSTIPELIKTMATNGYDELKVFEVENADPDLALQIVQRSVDDPNRTADQLEETRDILTRYGTRNLPFARGFSAPFLWYNILPGRSVPLRKLPVHLFHLRAASQSQGQITGEDVEDQARRLASTVPGVRSLGECFVARVRIGFIVGINVALDQDLPVSESFLISQQVSEVIRNANSKIRHIFVQVFPHEPV